MQDHMLHCDNQGLAGVWSCQATLSECADVGAYNLVVIGPTPMVVRPITMVTLMVAGMNIPSCQG